MGSCSSYLIVIVTVFTDLVTHGTSIDQYVQVLLGQPPLQLNVLPETRVFSIRRSAPTKDENGQEGRGYYSDGGRLTLFRDTEDDLCLGLDVFDQDVGHE